MVAVVEHVRARIAGSCLAKTIKKDGCALSLSGAPVQRLIVDFDKSGSPLVNGGQRCDYLFVGEESCSVGWVCPIELKKGNLDASEVVGQLRAGAAVAEQIVPEGTLSKFRPVAAFGGIHKAERVALKKSHNRVWFRGTSETVRLLRCGKKLVDCFDG